MGRCCKPTGNRSVLSLEAFHLREADAGRFEPIYRRWLREANPPLHVRLDFAIVTDGSTSPPGLTGEVVESVIKSGTASGSDLIEVLRAREKGRAKPEQIRRAGERLVALDPANRSAVDLNYLWALMEWNQAEEAKAMFATVRGHAQPGNNEDERMLWSCSRRLGSVRKPGTDKGRDVQLGHGADRSGPEHL
jgi:hypothetical protein